MPDRTVPLVDALASDAPARLRADFDANGFTAVAPVIPGELVARATEAMDAVVRGNGGHQPLWRNGEATTAPSALVKIDQPHWANDVLWEVVTHPELARWAAALSGAQLVQVFAVQLLVKPPDGGGEDGNVGWHRDDSYWREWWRGEAFTAWVALSEVTVEGGPMRLVRGSHRWSDAGGGDFFEHDLAALRAQFEVPDGEVWEERCAVLPPGGVSFHSRRTIHGSGRNLGGAPRRSLAVHLRTERAVPVPGRGFSAYCNGDPRFTPVIHGRLAEDGVGAAATHPSASDAAGPPPWSGNPDAQTMEAPL